MNIQEIQETISSFVAIADNARQGFDANFYKWQENKIEELQKEVQLSFNGLLLVAEIEETLAGVLNGKDRVSLLHNIEVRLNEHLFYVNKDDLGKCLPELESIKNVKIHSIADWNNFTSKTVEEGLKRLHKMFGIPDTPTASQEQPQGGTDEKPKAHFNCRMTDEELTRIFEQLKQSGFIASDSVSNDWLYIFKGGKDRTATAKIMWIAKNKRTRRPNKKSLLDLLVLMGFTETDIRANINQCFKVEAASNYTSKDYTKNWYNNIKSEYHITLYGIIKNIKK